MSHYYVQPALFEIAEETQWEAAKSAVQKALGAYTRLSDKAGGLMLPKHAATALGLSKQRVYQLMEARKLTVYEFEGHRFLSVREVNELALIERDGGTRYEKKSK